MFIGGCFAYILFDRQTDRRAEGFRFPKKITKIANSIKNTAFKAPIVGGAIRMISDKIDSRKNTTKSVKEGVCLPKTSQLKKNYPELNKVLMMLSNNRK
jgi:hypothetical protein